MRHQDELVDKNLHKGLKVSHKGWPKRSAPVQAVFRLEVAEVGGLNKTLLSICSSSLARWSGSVSAPGSIRYPCKGTSSSQKDEISWNQRKSCPNNKRFEGY
jgi:hypothetical protein